MQLDLDFFRDLLRIPSVTADIPQVNRAVAAMGAWLAGAGLHVSVETMPDGRHVLYAGTRDGRTPDVLLNAHLDVVPAAPALFEPRVEGGRWFGRGVADCKGNALACAAALRALAGTAADVGALFSTDEEAGGDSTAWAVAHGCKARRIVLLLDAAAYAIANAQKGILTLRLRARGRGGHSAEPWTHENPIDRLFAGYLALRKAWPALPDGSHWGDTMCGTVVRAGAVFNQVPDEAEMVVNIRYTTPGDEARLAAFVRSASGLEAEVLNGCPPVFCDETHPEMERLREAMKRVFARDDIPFLRMDGATDARHFAAPGAAPVAILGVHGGSCHRDDEWLDLASVSAYADLIVSFVS